MFNRPALIIYHKNCHDGFTAAWAMAVKLSEENRGFDMLAADYGDIISLPDVAGRDVFIVDYSYSERNTKRLIETCKRLIVLDHHKTAQQALGFLPEGPKTFEEFQDKDRFPEKAYKLIDMHRSGAGITWDFCFPDSVRPALVQYVEDYDLAKYELDGTREIMASIHSYPYDLSMWSRLVQEKPQELYHEGIGILRKLYKDAGELIESYSQVWDIGGYRVPVVNAPYTMANAIGESLCVGVAFSATYYDTSKKRRFSLRSTKNGVDVSEIAKLYGGGGHKNAAGFEIWPEQCIGGVVHPKRG